MEDGMVWYGAMLRTANLHFITTQARQTVQDLIAIFIFAMLLHLLDGMVIGLSFIVGLKGRVSRKNLFASESCKKVMPF